MESREHSRHSRHENEVIVYEEKEKFSFLTRIDAFSVKICIRKLCDMFQSGSNSFNDANQFDQETVFISFFVKHELK